ncbi:CCL25 protein, partial [Polypterus senegalus]
MCSRCLMTLFRQHFLVWRKCRPCTRKHSGHPWKVLPPPSQVWSEVSLFRAPRHSRRPPGGDFAPSLRSPQHPGSYENCCLKYNKHVSTRTMKAGFKSYRKQETDGGCNIQAIVLTSNSGKKVICANPTAKWVKKIMAKIDKQAQEDRQKFRSSDQPLTRKTRLDLTRLQDQAISNEIARCLCEERMDLGATADPSVMWETLCDKTRKILEGYVGVTIVPRRKRFILEGTLDIISAHGLMATLVCTGN